MRVMAIGALNYTFVHAVLYRHVELRSDRTMAVVAKIRLRLRQQELRSGRAMNGMAVRADNVGQGVLGTPYLGPREILAVTREAIVEHLLRLQLGERDDGRFASASLNVRFTGTMAAFASGTFRWFRRRRNAFVVRVLIKVQPHVRVARPAHRAADELRIASVWCVREWTGLGSGRGRKNRENQRNCGQRQRSCETHSLPSQRLGKSPV